MSDTTHRVLTVTAVLACAVLASVSVSLTSTAHATASAGCVYLAEPPYPANLRIRSGPGMGYPPVGTIGYQETASGPCRVNGSWTMIWGDGCNGWAYTPYLVRID